MPAFSNALFPAKIARLVVFSSFATLLSLIPERLLIHSSLVSTILDKSSFVTICSGTALPVPIILAVILFTSIFKYFDNQTIYSKYTKKEVVCQHKQPLLSRSLIHFLLFFLSWLIDFPDFL